MIKKLLIYTTFAIFILIVSVIQQKLSDCRQLRFKTSLKHFIAFFTLLLLTLYFCYPITRDLQNIGYWDWDHHLFNHQVPIVSLKLFGQLPLWNPYYCGGHVLWQNPQVRFFTPMFIFHLFFGPVLAIKIEIILHYFIALWGMYRISIKIFNIKNFILAIFPAFYFVFNSSISAHLKEGHTWILSFAYIPFVFYFYNQYIGTSRKKNTIISSVFLSLMLYEGGIYPVPFTILFLFLYSFLNTAFKRNWSYILAFIQVVIFTLLFSSMKIIPMLEFFNEHPRITYDVEHIPFKALYDIFLSRSQVYYHQAYPDQLYGWQDYTGYIGVFLFFILIVGVGLLLCNRDERSNGFILVLIGGLFFSCYWAIWHGGVHII